MAGESGENNNKLEMLRKMLAEAEEAHGRESQSAQFIRRQIAEASAPPPGGEGPAQGGGKSAPGSIDTSMEKGSVIFIALGATLIFALLGMSTMFLGMLAVKWLAL